MGSEPVPSTRRKSSCWTNGATPPSQATGPYRQGWRIEHIARSSTARFTRSLRSRPRTPEAAETATGNKGRDKLTSAAPAATRELIAGLLVAVLGAATIMEAITYDVGRLDHVGPGFYPTLLGGILVLLGVAIIGVRHRGGHEDEH